MHNHLKMVDITEKEITYREAKAEGHLTLNEETVRLIQENRIEKGDVLIAAKLAGISAAKKCDELIPLCHPIEITHVNISTELTDNCIHILTSVKSKSRTGAEMEALLATALALLTIYDMCKQYDAHMMLRSISLISKKGGKST